MITSKLTGYTAIRILPALGMFFLVLFVFPRAQAQSDQVLDDAVYAITMNQLVLSEGTFGYENNEKIYMPVAGLANLYGIFVKLDNGVASGFIFDQKNSFSVNANTKQLTSKGETITLPSDSILSAGFSSDDVYLDIEYFKNIWPLELEANRPALALKTIADKDLPFVELLERKKRQQKLTESQETKDNTVRPFLAYPYQLYSKPIFSIDSTAGYIDEQGEPSATLAIGGTQDLLYAQADYNIRMAQNGGEFTQPENLRLRFRRQNIHEGALPFGLEDTQWGDVSIRNRELVGAGASGRGATFSTNKNNYSNEFDLITIDGVSTPGWETELYINNELILFGEVQDDGIYRFEDVSVSYGRNDIRVVFYGPQGQVDERTETYVYRSNMVRSGENFFTGGIIDQNEYLIPLDEREIASEAEGVAANIYGARGITDRLTLFASANLINDQENRRDVDRRYLTAGAMVSFNQALVQAEAYKQIDGGSALDVRTASDFFGFKVNTQTALYNDFESPDARYGDNAKEFEFDFDIRKSFKTAIGAIGLQWGMDHLRRVSGQDSTILRERVSYGVNGFNFSNTTRTTLIDSDHVNTNGTFVSSRNYKRLNIRNSINYLLYPDVDISTVDLSLRYRFKDDYDASLSLQRNFLDDTSAAGIQVSKDFETFRGGLGMNWSSESGVAFSVRANTSLGPFGQDGSYIASADPLRNMGPISAFTYNDRDYNGVFSEGDVPVEKVRMRIGKNVNKNETNENGYMFDINPAGVNRLTNVSIANETIEDPYLIPGNSGYSVYLRPGVVHNIQIPLIETGAIDGTLRWNNGNPIAGLELDLMNLDGEITKTSITAPDGYFTFERVVPGNYTIRAAPSTGLVIPFKYVDLTPDNLFQFGMDITAVDFDGVDSNLDIGFDGDSQMQANNILTLAKGIKGREPEGFYNENGKTKSGKSNQLNASQFKEKLSRLSILSPRAGQTDEIEESSNVTGVRIGKHPGKERVVLDLSQKTEYNVNYDKINGQIIVEMPNARWSAKDEWRAKRNSIVNKYQIEPFEAGVKMIMAVAEGASVAKSGLLNADHGKKDRLYIDIISN